MTLIAITILLLTVTGVTLVIAGLRGRMTDSHPVCRRCGFDLIGRFPWAEPSCPACPDCGQLLIGHRSVRPGARAARGRMVAAGWMLCFPACILGMAWIADSLAGGATAAIKPTAVMTAQLAGATRSTPTLRRLTARVSTGAAGGGEIQPVVERALLLQADRSKTVDGDWLDFLEVCRRRGLLTLQQQERFLRNAADFSILSRPTTANGRLALALQVFVDRLPATDKPLFIQIKPLDATLDQKIIPLTAGGGGPFTGKTLVEVIDSLDHDAGQVLDDAPLQTQWSVEVHESSGTGPLLAAWSQQADGATPIGRRPPHRDSDVLTADVSLLPSLRGAFSWQSLSLQRQGDECWVTLAALHRPPVDLVAQLRITAADGREFLSAEPVFFTPTDPRWTAISQADPTRSPLRHRVRLSGTPAAGVAKVELIPLPAVGLTGTLARRLWSGRTVEVESTRLEWGPADPVPGQP